MRFQQRNGVEPGPAVSTGLIASVCNFFVQVLFILVITISGLASLNLSQTIGSSSSGATSSSSSSVPIWVFLVGLVLLGILVGLAVPRYRHTIVDSARRYRAVFRAQASASLTSLRVLRSTKRLAMIFGGGLFLQIVQAVVLGFCVEAFGFRASLAGLILVNTAVSLFAGFMPVPGGMGVAEAGYTAGLVGLGMPHDAALAAAIAFRLMTFYLPPIWGTFALRWLRRHEYV